MMIKLAACVENIDIYEDLIVSGLSNLQGNKWDGGITVVSSKNEKIITQQKTSVGVTIAKFLPWSFQSSQAMDQDNQDSALDFNPEGLIAAACDNGEIQVYHFQDQNNSPQLSPLHTWDAHEDIVSSILVDKYHPNENSHLLVSCSWDSSIRLWDMENFQTLQTRKNASYSLNKAHLSQIYDISFTSYHPSMLISGGEDCFVRIWDLRLPSKHGCSIIMQHESPVTCISWNDCDKSVGTTFFCGTFSGEIHYHDFRFPVPLTERIYSSAGAVHSRRVKTIRPIKSQQISEEVEGFLLLSGADDGRIVLTSMNPVNKPDSFRIIER